MLSPSDWSTGQEDVFAALARDAAQDDISMLSTNDWGLCEQHDAKDPRPTVPESTASDSCARQNTALIDDDDDNGRVLDLFEKKAWDDCDDVNSFVLSLVRLDEDEKVM